MLRKILLAVALFLPLTAVADQASNQAVSDALKNNIRMVRHLALNPLLIDAVERQNAQSLDMTTVRERDRRWANSGDFTTLKTDMQDGYHGMMIKDFIDRHGDFSEAVLTDNLGANVAAYPLSGDYWQGDEEGWRKSFNEGQGQVFISPLQQDPASGVISTRIAAPVLSRNETVGVLLVGVELNAAR